MVYCGWRRAWGSIRSGERRDLSFWGRITGVRSVSRKCTRGRSARKGTSGCYRCRSAIVWKTSEEIKCKFGLTDDKLKHPQWLECYITPLPQCITTLCIVSCGQRITRATNTDMCLYHVRTTWKVYHSIQWVESKLVFTSLVPRPSRLQFLIACSVQKLSLKAWWILTRDCISTARTESQL